MKLNASFDEITLKRICKANGGERYVTIGAFNGAMFGKYANDYAIREDDVDISISLDTVTGKFNVAVKDKEGISLDMSPDTKIYKLMYSMIDMDALKNDGTCSMNLPDWFDEEQQKYLATCPSIEECMDYSRQDDLFNFMEDINEFRAASDALSALSADIVNNNRHGGTLMQEMYEALRGYVESYQVVLVEAGRLYNKSCDALRDEHSYFTPEALEREKYLNKRLKTIVYTEPLYDNIVKWYNEFLTRASGGDGEVVDHARSVKISEAVNMCFNYINRMRPFHASLCEIRNKVLYA